MQTQLKTDTVSSVQSQQISNYVLDTTLYNSQSCNSHFNCKVSFKSNSIDEESKLFGLGQMLNKLPINTVEYDETERSNNVKITKNDDKFLFEDTNISTKVPKSGDVLSGVTIDRFAYIS